MRRPIGIIAVALYFCCQSVAALVCAFMYSRKDHMGFWFCAWSIVSGLIAYGLFRLWEWARFAGMFILFVGVGLTTPSFILRTRQLDLSLFLMIAAYVVNLLLVWYLFRSATAKLFTRMLKSV